MSARSLTSIISVHDVMPQTLPNVREMLKTVLRSVNPTAVQLLVVPGLEWQPSEIAQLRQWSVEGYELAGHGWRHHVQRIEGWYHRWHSWLISRQAAEHLSQSADDLMQLVQRNHQWFVTHDLPSPQLYVPPAWALGQLTLAQVQDAGFGYLETTQGIADLSTQSWRRLPLAGFEADVRWRQALLQGWNLLNATLASNQRPLRLAMHPHDLQYYLSGQLRAWLAQRVVPLHYTELFADAEPAQNHAASGDMDS